MHFVSLDLETDIADLANGEVPNLVCGVFYTPGHTPEILDAQDTARRFERLCDDGDCVFVGHNFSFDLRVLWKYAPHLVTKIFRLYAHGRVRDTQVRQQLLDVRAGIASDSSDEDDGGRVIFRQKNGVFYKSGLSLADLTFHHLGIDRYAEKKDPNSPRMRFVELVGLPASAYPAEFTDYLLRDGTGTWEVFKAQGPDCLANEIEQVESAFDLALIEQRGMRVNRGRTARLRETTSAAFEKVRAAMTGAGFYRGVDGPKCIAPFATSQIGTKNKGLIESRLVQAYSKQGLAPPRTKPTKTKPYGGISCDKDSLKNSGDPLLVELSGSGPLGSIMNTFLPVLEAGIEKRIHTRFNNLLATGRISSARPNLNNIPRGGGVRECTEATPGFAICSSDYDCAELRSHAQVNHWLGFKPAMREFFLRDPKGDPHAELAASILKISSEEAKARKKAKDREFADARQASKALNFGLPGGMGPERLRATAKRQYGVVMSSAEAKKRKFQWKQRWPEMGRYFDFITHLADTKSCFAQMAPPGHGKHRVRGRNPQDGSRWFSQAANSYFQGLTADGAKRALALVTRACHDPSLNSPLYGSHVIGFLYDELLVEIPLDRFHASAMELERLMVEGMSYWVPDVPITAGPKGMTVWSKGAEAIWKDGELQVWSPPDLLAAM